MDYRENKVLDEVKKELEERKGSSVQRTQVVDEKAKRE